MTAAANAVFPDLKNFRWDDLQVLCKTSSPGDSGHTEGHSGRCCSTHHFQEMGSLEENLIHSRKDPGIIQHWRQENKGKDYNGGTYPPPHLWQNFLTAKGGMLRTHSPQTTGVLFQLHFTSLAMMSIRTQNPLLTDQHCVLFSASVCWPSIMCSDCHREANLT